MEKMKVKYIMGYLILYTAMCILAQYIAFYMVFGYIPFI